MLCLPWVTVSSEEGEAVQCGGEEGDTLACLAALNSCVCHSSPCLDFNLHVSVFN